LQRLKDPNQINGDNPKNVKSKTSSHFKNKWREYLKNKMNDFATQNKHKNVRVLYRETNKFKMSYQARTNLEKNEKSDMLAASHNI
jgi:hypothetical protein